MSLITLAPAETSIAKIVSCVRQLVQYVQGAPWLKGTTTNDNAPAGVVGEYATASGTNSPASGVVADIGSISLTAGDWDVEGAIQTNTGGNITGGSVWLSAASATDPTFPNEGAYYTANVPPGTNVRCPIGIRRFSLATTTTIYLSAQIFWTVSNTNTGFIRARRMR